MGILAHLGIKPGQLGDVERSDRWSRDPEGWSYRELFAILAWQFFSTALSSCQGSLIISFVDVLISVVILAGLWLASLNVQDRVFRYVVPFLVQFGLYVSPVGFSSAIVPERWQLLYALNPLGFWLSMAIVALLLVTGIRQFRRLEKRFADVTCPAPRSSESLEARISSNDATLSASPWFLRSPSPRAKPPRKPA